MRIVNYLDHIFFLIFLFILIFLITTSTKMNIDHDAVDYYGMLQWLTPEKEKPIVRNLYFAEQRSPGYPLLSLIPYYMLTLLVEPLVKTEKVTAYNLPPKLPIKEPKLKKELKVPGLPPKPLLIKDLFFKDYYLPQEGSWYQWKLALSLLLTSFFFLFLGLWANAKVLSLYFSEVKGLILIPGILVSSHMFMRSIFDLPMFSTLTYYGLSSLYLLLICLFLRTNKGSYAVLSGLTLGLLVLTRLELSILLILLISYLLWTKKLKFLQLLCLGGLLPFIILLIYNFSLFKTPLHLAILRGDINILGFNGRYILANIFHPQSGVLFWTPLLIPGLVFLIFAKDSLLKFHGFCSFLLIFFYTLRIPIMFYHLGQGIINIGGIPVEVPENMAQMRQLIRFDINRYICVLIPFSILGTRIGLSQIYKLFEKRKNKALSCLKA